MARYAPEPPFRHDRPQRTGVLLVNLGTPAAPTPEAVRPFLREFLSDPRVIELPRWLWQTILHLFILPRRPKANAQKYASIWLDEGSPLEVYTERLTHALESHWTERGREPLVRWAMRYGEPSVAKVLARMKEEGLRRLLVVPLYPQYCASTTASVFDAVAAELMRWRDVPELRLVRHWHDDPRYIEALAQTLETHWAQHGRPDKLILSFHGMPRRTLELGDPYHCECHKTARLVAERLRLAPDQWLVTFQSRFGRARWLEPYTQPTLERLAREGVARVDVLCPGFATDCLETLEEIGMECRTAFLEAGGKQFHYVPCLNDSPFWVERFAALLEDHLGHWPDRTPSTDEELQARLARAKAMGAKQ